MTHRLLKYFKFVILSLLTTGLSLAQGNEDTKTTLLRPEYIGFPSLTIAPDARSAGMADLGVATSGDPFALYHNSSKLALGSARWGVGLGYTPWLSDFIKGISLNSLYGFYSVENAGLKHVFQVGLRYFHIGETVAFPPNNAPAVSIYPYEVAVDMGYALKWHPKWAGGVALRWALSDMNYQVNQLNSRGSTVLVDLSTTFKDSVRIGGYEAELAVALTLNNMGGKISLDEGISYLFAPAVFRLGAGLATALSTTDHIALSLELDKSMAPTPPTYGTEGYEEKLDTYLKQSALQGLLKSWGDAPGGIGDELKEVSVAVGAEYTYNRQIVGRAGYRYMSKERGNCSGLSLGLGFRYLKYALDASYFVASESDNPLNNTFRVTLSTTF